MRDIGQRIRDEQNLTAKDIRAVNKVACFDKKHSCPLFRWLRRYTNQMDHFGAKEATQRFFDLFAFYYNLRVLRSGKREGNSLFAAAHVNVVEIFGTDDPYTILGFPPVSQSFESVQSNIA